MLPRKFGTALVLRYLCRKIKRNSSETEILFVTSLNGGNIERSKNLLKMKLLNKVVDKKVVWRLRS